jgi:hypothetical protein
MKPIMNEFDAIHPYHFTDQEILDLIPNNVQISKTRRKDFVDMEVKTAQILPKIKLLIAQGLGTHRLLIHLDKTQI